jgi:hypothetical protein
MFRAGWTVEVQVRRIRCNVLSHGPIATPLVDAQPQHVMKKLAASLPMGRTGEPGEVAKAALFLASDDSSLVTGIELFVGGGRRRSDPAGASSLSEPEARSPHGRPSFTNPETGESHCLFSLLVRPAGPAPG